MRSIQRTIYQKHKWNQGVLLVSKKNGVLKDMWDAIRKDDRPHWEVMADDGMNKFLKFCIFCVFAYGFVVVAIELFDRFFG